LGQLINYPLVNCNRYNDRVLVVDQNAISICSCSNGNFSWLGQKLGSHIDVYVLTTIW